MRIWIINLLLVMMLTGCSSVPVKMAVEITPSTAPTITFTPTLTPSPAPTATPLPLTDQLIFEREIPQLSQEEMAKIVKSAYRFTDGYGHTYSLGYIPEMLSYFSIEGIVIDLEKSSSEVDGDEFWRLLMITEDKKAGGFETPGKKLFLIVPMYLDNDKENKYQVNFMATPGGAPSAEGAFPKSVDSVISALLEQKEKHGYYQINASSYYTVSDYYLEMSKTLSGWSDREKRLMRIYNNDKEAAIFVDLMLKNDYQGAVDYLKSEKPFMTVIHISISSN